MTTYCVQYVYDDRTARRDEVRPAHRDHLRGLLETGRLLASGPYQGSTVLLRGGLAEPAVADAPGGAPEPSGALLLLRCEDLGELGAVLDADPFWQHGLIAERSVRAWDPVIGPWSS